MENKSIGIFVWSLQRLFDFLAFGGQKKYGMKTEKKKKILKIFKCLQIDIQLKTNDLPCDRAGMFFPLFLSSRVVSLVGLRKETHTERRRDKDKRPQDIREEKWRNQESCRRLVAVCASEAFPVCFASYVDAAAPSHRPPLPPHPSSRHPVEAICKCFERA